MALHPSVADRLARLAPDQRAAATAPPGPVLCVAPAGSGKTTTLVARVAWLVAGGRDPATLAVLAFNRRAAEELSERLDQALAPLAVEPGTVRVRTFHALGLEMLREAGLVRGEVVDRDALLRRLSPDSTAADRTRLDLAFSRLKLDLQVTSEEIATDPAPGPIAQAFVAYEHELRASGDLDFDDLVARALRLLRDDGVVLRTWRGRCEALLVDEAQDLDRTQLDLALLLAAPTNDIFLVGDDDQTIYAWRLAEVRRILGLAARLPGLRRVDLTVNYRCPRPVVERAVRLVETNGERFAKVIAAGPRADGRLILAPDATDDAERVGRVLRGWPADDSTRAVLARTNRELMPALVAALDVGLAVRAPGLRLLVEDERIDVLLAAAAALPDDWPLLVRIARVRAKLARDGLELAQSPAPTPRSMPEGLVTLDHEPPDSLAASLLGWAAPYRDLPALAGAIHASRSRLAALRRDDAPLSLATAHATKGAEWDHVLVLCDGFPARRALRTATDPARALEEERRLSYVAWTRARRSLTLLYDPAAPSPFLLDAFEPDELGLTPAAARDTDA